MITERAAHLTLYKHLDSVSPPYQQVQPELYWY